MKFCIYYISLLCVHVLIRWKMLKTSISSWSVAGHTGCLCSQPLLVRRCRNHLRLVTFSQKSQLAFPVRRFSLSILFLPPSPHGDSPGQHETESHPCAAGPCRPPHCTLPSWPWATHSPQQEKTGHKSTALGSMA